MKETGVVEADSNFLEQGRLTSTEMDKKRLFTEFAAALGDHALRTQFRQNVFCSDMAAEEKLNALVALGQCVIEQDQDHVDAELGAERKLELAAKVIAAVSQAVTYTREDV